MNTNSRTLFYISEAMLGRDDFSFTNLEAPSGWEFYRFEHKGVGVRFDIRDERDDAHMLGVHNRIY